MARVVIDARSVVAARSGIGGYVESLVRHLVPIADDLRFLLLRHPDARQPLVEHERVSELRFSGQSKSPQTLLWLGRAHRFEGYDLYHAPADVTPLGLRCPWVVTMHDLMWIEQPRLASAFLPERVVNSLWYRFAFGHSVRGARRVITVSQATADAVLRVYPEHAHKVRVVHHGIDPVRHSAERAPPRSTLDPLVPPGARFSLIVGQGSPYKNHAAMLRAFLLATRDDPGHKLVLVRRFSRVDFEMSRLLARSEVRDRVVAVPFVSDEQMLALFRHARMLLFASHYEGFGLPTIEAMAAGTPVLASTAPALREVAGDAALYAVAADPADLAAKIRELDRDEVLRERLIEAGLARVRAFSWPRCAELTLAVYREALATAAAPGAQR